MQLKKLKLITILFFLIILILPGVQALFEIFPKHEIHENRTKTILKDIKFPLGLFNKDSIENLTDYFNDNYGFREELISLNSLIDYSIFHVSSSNRVVIGKKDWLFFKDEIESYTNRDVMSDREIDEIARKIKGYQEFLLKHDKKFIFVLTPNKSTVYPEFMNGKYKKGDANKSNYLRLMQAFQKYNVNYYEPLETLEKNKITEQLYYKTDTHWNNMGGYLAFRELLGYLDVLSGESLAEPILSGREEISYTGDLSRMLALKLTEREETLLLKSQLNSKLPSILWYRDSYSDKLLTYLQPYKSVIYDLHHTQMPMNRTEYKYVDKADIVVFQMLERFLPTLKYYDFSRAFPLYSSELTASDFKELSDVQLSNESLLKVTSTSSDPHFELNHRFELSSDNKYTLVLEIQNNSSSKQYGQVFFRKEDGGYNEKNSVRYELPTEEEFLTFEIPDDMNFIRIDPLNAEGVTYIKSIDIYYEPNI
ncbi:hypothetical protein D3C74_156690 [compost metagenome]